MSAAPTVSLVQTSFMETYRRLLGYPLAAALDRPVRVVGMASMPRAARCIKFIKDIIDSVVHRARSVLDHVDAGHHHRAVPRARYRDVHHRLRHGAYCARHRAPPAQRGVRAYLQLPASYFSEERRRQTDLAHDVHGRTSRKCEHRRAEDPRSSHAPQDHRTSHRGHALQQRPAHRRRCSCLRR